MFVTEPTLSHGTNMGGTPWAHLAFAWMPGVLPGQIGEAFFHRIDRRMEEGNLCYYLSTRQYAKVKGSPEAMRAKLLRLGSHRAAFRDAVARAGTALKFSTPAADNQGANESEIGVLFFDADVNTPTAVLESFPAVHRAFVEALTSAAGPGE